jgi:sulfoxide reductase heme-binding subunit YedZ
MTPLAATSFNAAIRWLGAKRWQALHRLVYVVAVAALLHFFWMRSAKNNYAEPIVYLAILGSLLGYRVWRKFSTRAA